MTDRKSTAQNPLGRVKTDRIGLASFLLTRGLELIGVEGEGRSITFVFDGEDAQAEVQHFYDGAQVSAIAFVRAERTIKDSLWDRRRTFERDTNDK